MSFKTKNVSLRTVGDREFQLEDSVVYTGKCGDHTAPAGFVTDFASVPAMVQWLIPSYGKYALAAIIHDWYCVLLAKGRSPIESRDVDGIFRRIMRELEVPFLRRWVMWTGVRWGAMLNKHRRPGILPDLPLMLLWSILAAPLVAPVSLLVGAGLLIDKVFQAVVGRFLR